MIQIRKFHPNATNYKSANEIPNRIRDIRYL